MSALSDAVDGDDLAAMARGAKIRKERAEVEQQIQQDAAKWRALMACRRIRVLGSARLGELDGHVGLELWGDYPELENVQGRATLEKFVAGLMRYPSDGLGE